MPNTTHDTDGRPEATHDELLALYALDLLKDSDREQLLQHLQSTIPTPELALELQLTAQTAALIGYGADPLDPSTSLKDKLLQRIQASQLPPCRLSATRFCDLQWQPHPVAGVDVAILNVDETRREALSLFRAQDPTVYPVHRHAGPEEILVLHGDLQVGSFYLQAGDYIRSETGSAHSHATVNGCLCVARTCLDDQFQDNPVSPEAQYPCTQIPYTQLQWNSFATAGIEVALLHTDQDHQEIIGILRTQAGIQYPLHEHGDVEEILMLSGDLIIEEQIFGPGDYLRSPAGSAHNPYSRLGCTFFFRASMSNLFLDPA